CPSVLSQLSHPAPPPTDTPTLSLHDALPIFDPANVGMVDLTLSADAFESYEADGGVIGVDLSRLQDIASMAGNDDLVHLELDEETRKPHISIDELRYTPALIQPQSVRQPPDVPEPHP